MIAPVCRESIAKVYAHYPFPRAAFKCAVVVLLPLMLIVTLIHTRPFSDGGLHDFLFEGECSLPCFMGIRPGITTAEQAYELLQQEGLVSDWIEPPHPLEQIGDDAGFGLLRWHWSKKRPALLTSTDASLVYNRRTGYVITFGSMGTRLSLGEAFILLGQPSMGFLTAAYNDRSRPTFTHVASYPQWHFNLVNNIPCPMTMSQLWQSSVTLELANTIGENSRFTIYPVRVQPLLSIAASNFC